MQLSMPGSELINPQILAIMRALARVATPLTGRQIARVTDQAQTTTSRLLTLLVGSGVVLTTTVGRASHYSPNRRHLYWRIFQTLQDFDDMLRSELGDLLPQIGSARESVFLFGSYGRGAAGSASDIDVGVVVDTEAQVAAVEAQIYEGGLGARVEAWTGNRLGPFVISWATFVRMVQGGEGLIEAWATDGDTLQGTDIIELIQLARDTDA